MSELGLADKVAIVTGGAGGLGQAFARGLLDAGAKVVVADRNAEAAASVARDLARKGADKGADVAAVTVDVVDEASVARLFEAARERFGGIDLLVNNAGVYAGVARRPFYEISVAEWDGVLAVNLKGAFLCAKAAVPHMRARGGGKIVNVASSTVFSGSPLWMHYVASKGGMIAMTRVMARELGELGITANALAPGFTLTEASRSVMEDAETYGVARGAIKRAAQPEDVVGACLWLGSPLSDFVTGQTIIVDGGRQFI